MCCDVVGSHALSTKIACPGMVYRMAARVFFTIEDYAATDPSS